MVWTKKGAMAIGVVACVAFLWTTRIAHTAEQTSTPPAQTAAKEPSPESTGPATSKAEGSASGEEGLVLGEGGVLHVELKFDRKVAIATNLILMWIGVLGLVCILLMKIREADRVLQLKYEKSQDTSP